jgi:hypothetical protein
VGTAPVACPARSRRSFAAGIFAPWLNPGPFHCSGCCFNQVPLADGPIAAGVVLRAILGTTGAALRLKQAGEKRILMRTPQLDPARFHQLAAEYRGLAKTCATQKEKAELLDLAARFTALAELDHWKPHRRKDPEAHRIRRRTFKFASDPVG